MLAIKFYFYMIMLVTDIFFILMLLTDAWGGYRKHEDSEDSCTAKEFHAAEADEPLGSQQANILLTAKTEAAEEALIEASQQSFQLNMDALDAYCQMADVALKRMSDYPEFSDDLS